MDGWDVDPGDGAILGEGGDGGKEGLSAACAFSCAEFWSLWLGLCFRLQNSCVFCVFCCAFWCALVCASLLLDFGVCVWVCAPDCKTVVFFIVLFGVL